MNPKKKASIFWIFLGLLFLFKIKECDSAVSSCNARLTAKSGTFTSPNYPNPPPRQRKTESSTTHPGQMRLVTCKWEIEVPSGKGIQLKFGHFDMAHAPLDDCEKGHVEVFSGTGKDKSSLDKYCPGNTPDTLSLSNNSATVLFKRPPDFRGTGFLISYIAISPGETYDDFITCTDIGQIHADVESFSVMCPSGCGSITAHRVWGDVKYRDNSHLCRAAIHAGVISDEFGGRVNVKRESGSVLYYGEEANNVTALTGAMSDSRIVFPDLMTCHEMLRLQPKQFSSSSYWNTTDKSGRIQLWLPQKALLESLPEAWSPDDPTIQQWLQVDLGRVMDITGIVTKGSSKPYSYTESFTIKYSFNNITWHGYKERRHRRAKVFAGNTNFFGKVRNNFVEPRLKARHIRVYPIRVNDALPRYVLKLGLMGCDSQDSDGFPVIPSTEASTTTTAIARSTKPTTSTTSTTTRTTTRISIKTTVINKGLQNEKSETSSASNAVVTNSTMVASEDKETNDVIDPVISDTGVGAKDLSERSILIIAIVTALAVTSILLAALVLILVRKRKKEPKLDTMVPKTNNSQTNVTYHTAIGMHYLNYNNNHDHKRSKKKEKNALRQTIEFKNDNYKDGYPPNGVTVANSNTNLRGGVTLPYDQRYQPLANGDASKGSAVPVHTSFPVKGNDPGASLMHSGKQGLQNGDTASFTSDDDDHEYQVIPDPVSDYSSHVHNSSSKGSTCSSVGARSKASDSGAKVHGAMWGTAGDSWGKDFISDSGKLSSFVPQNRANLTPVSRAGTFSHPTHFSVKDEEVNPLLPPGPKTAPPYSSSTSQFSIHSRHGGQSHCSPHRFSSSSGGSSSRYDSTMAPYYASVPEDQENSLRNGGIVSHSTSSTEARKPQSFQYPNRKHSESCNLPNSHSKEYNGLSQHVAYPAAETTNGFGVQRSNSRTDSYNHAKFRSGYDHLYRNKTMTGPDGNKCVVAMTTSDYNQLDFKSAI